ncbi:hypothetical protein HNQ91_001714 [Filimonas zeae]|uniref:DUF2024 domain-containing protein n=1 Tax=Filimonas zeae TaxID=1737353 RepID=A0A917IX13_9BACT|nr:DUF2024 family protein [Filimonas zeae]MDR6338663.1 hypothetical protein [Filimonas zeae]GGH67171.1 hypothetical protein GCM10011379_22140 [Filimonas zeae]
MKVAVYDTYVTRKDGGVMHFDILVPETLGSEEQVLLYGKDYLTHKKQEGQPLTTRECRYCHIEEASETVVNDIEARGYSIIEMQGC